MYLRKAQTLFLTILSLTLLGCGGSSSTSIVENDNNNDNIEGTLVVPISSQTVAARVIREGLLSKTSARLAASVACPDVPAGYKPLQNVTVEFLDSTDISISNTTTDDCGKFSALVTDDVVSVKASSTGNQDLITDVSVFKTADNSITVASTIPTGAQYQISAIQVTTDNSLAFSITDTLTNNAVIGMPDSALTVKINGSETTVSDLSNAANTVDDASVTLVMDASGSMGAQIVDTNGNLVVDPSDSSNYSRFRMAGIAAHTYLDNMPSTDETAFTIFDDEVDFITDASIANLINFISSAPGASEATVPYTFSADGFTTTAADLRLIVDAYNPETEVFTSFGNYGTPPGPIRKNSETPDLKAFASVYPWRGLTSAYDAILTSLDKTSARTNSRKIVIAMTDGQDNTSTGTQADVISSANAKSIPVHTIGFGTSDSANTSLKKIADDTNATFFKVTGTDLVSVFQSIQTGITFQYVTSLASNIAVGDIVELSISYGGNEVKREITR